MPGPQDLLSQAPAPPPPAPPGERSSGLILALAIGSLAVMTGGVLFYQQWQARREGTYNGAGLDAESAPQDEAPQRAPASAEGGGAGGTAAPAAAGRTVPGSGAAADGGDSPRRAPPPAAARTPRQAAAEAFTAQVRANEKRFGSLAMDYTRRYPVIRQYGRDWMSHPDLKRFNDEYFQDHDPIKFAFNVAASPNFPALVKKYAGRPEMTAFIKDAAKNAPADLLKAARAYLETDSNASKLLARFAKAMGLPDALAASIVGGKPMDPDQAAQSVMKDNPELQDLLQQDGADPAKLNEGFQPPAPPREAGQ